MDLKHIQMSLFAMYVIVGWQTAQVTATGHVCWYPTIYNAVLPSADSNGMDVEPIPSGRELLKICPEGRKKLVVHCFVSKYEYVDQTKTISQTNSLKYRTVCTPEAGLICKPTEGFWCPDFSVQFGCKVAPGVPCPTSRDKGDKSMRSGSDVMKIPIALLLQAISTVLLLS